MLKDDEKDAPSNTSKPGISNKENFKMNKSFKGHFLFLFSNYNFSVNAFSKCYVQKRGISQLKSDRGHWGGVWNLNIHTLDKKIILAGDPEQI